MATRRKSAAKKKAKSSKKKASRRRSAAGAELAELRDHVAAIEGAVGEIQARLPELARAADVALLMELLQDFPAQLAAAGRETTDPPPPTQSNDGRWRSSVEELVSASSGAARDIHEALDGLPRDPEYGRFASQLRELAMVSPSLLDWLGQVPQLTQPLTASALGLRRAAGQLEAVSAKAQALLEDPTGSQSLAQRAAALEGELSDLTEKLDGAELPPDEQVMLSELGAAAAQLTESVGAKPKRRRKKS